MSIKLIIADDEFLVRESLAKVIDWDKIGVLVAGTAANGEEALRLIEEVQPDILLSDIKMPRLGGVELSAIVKERYPHIKMIFISGYSEFTYAHQALKNGVQDYILKPIRDEDVIAAVTAAAEKIREERSRNLASSDAFQEEEGKSHEDMAARARRYIDRHLAEDITLADVAAYAGVSSNYFCSVFKEQTGSTFVKYMLAARMEKAKEYLTHTGLRISEVASRVGYADAGYFSTVFRKYFGKAPSEFALCDNHSKSE